MSRFTIRSRMRHAGIHVNSSFIWDSPRSDGGIVGSLTSSVRSRNGHEL